MKCSKRNCKGTMKRSKAIQQTLTSGLPDFPNDKYPITLSAGGSGKLISCMKCDKCGHSEKLKRE